MRQDAFSGYHPAVNFIFFLGVLCFGVVILHPAYLLVGLAGAMAYYLLLRGRDGLRQLGLMLPVLTVVALVNPLFNSGGQRVLFSLLGRPYTVEALAYGGALAVMLLTMLLWFSCYSAVMTGDKFTSLFGNLLPALSLVLVMVFRLIPGLIRRGKQITGARKSLGKGDSGDEMAEAATILGSLTSWALEGSIVTADSMRSRGYGAARRTSFMIYRFTRRDRWLLAAVALLMLAMVALIATGATSASFTPQWKIAPLHPLGLGIYGALTLLPTILHLQEAALWHISRSKI